MDVNEALKIMGLDAEPDFSFIRGIDFSTPDGELDGKPMFRTRCRVPFVAPQLRNAEFSGGLVFTEKQTKADRDAGKPPSHEFEAIDEQTARALKASRDAAERVQIDPSIKVDPEATGDDGSDDEVESDALKNFRLEGIASSSSVDFYGTEMSLEALQSMAQQMSRGIPYLPRHMAGCFHSVEWDHVLGRTIFADVISADSVINAFDSSEDQYLLRVVTEIYGTEPKAAVLKRRLDRNEPIGQSIGGWFTELMFVTDGEGEIERVVVMGIELDHLALTRAPANPDSNNISMIRSKATAAYRDAISAAPMTNWGKVPDGIKFVVEHAVRSRGCMSDIKGVENDLLGFMSRGKQVASHLSMDDFLDATRDEEGLSLRHLLGVKDNEDGTVSIILAVSEEEDAESGRSSGDPDEGSRSTPATEPDEPVALDSTTSTQQDIPEDGSSDDDRDALGSAPAEDDSNATSETGGASEERDMSDENKTEGLTLDAIRAIFDEKVDPLIQRVAALEGPNGADKPEAAAAAEPENRDNVHADAAVAAAVARAEVAEARQKQLEGRLATRAAQANRVGRTNAVQLAQGSSNRVRTVIERRVAEARDAGEVGAFAHVIEANMDLLSANRVDEATPKALENVLRDGLHAACEDGLISDPSNRGRWS